MIGRSRGPFVITTLDLLTHFTRTVIGEGGTKEEIRIFDALVKVLVH